MNAKEFGAQHVSPVASGLRGMDGMPVLPSGMAYTLTKRELAAFMAMQSLMSDNAFREKALVGSVAKGISIGKIIALAACEAADALLAELAKDQP